MLRFCQRLDDMSRIKCVVITFMCLFDVTMRIKRGKMYTFMYVSGYFGSKEGSKTKESMGHPTSIVDKFLGFFPPDAIFPNAIDHGACDFHKRASYL